jgi:ribosomal protein L37AE/L43A
LVAIVSPLHRSNKSSFVVAFCLHALHVLPDLVVPGPYSQRQMCQRAQKMDVSTKITTVGFNRTVGRWLTGAARLSAGSTPKMLGGMPSRPASTSSKSPEECYGVVGTFNGRSGPRMAPEVSVRWDARLSRCGPNCGHSHVSQAAAGSVTCTHCSAVRHSPDHCTAILHRHGSPQRRCATSHCGSTEPSVLVG